MLRHFVSTDQRDWDLFLSLADFSMNDWYKSSIQCTRFQVVYWRTPATKHLETIEEMNPKACISVRQFHDS